MRFHEAFCPASVKGPVKAGNRWPIDHIRAWAPDLNTFKKGCTERMTAVLEEPLVTRTCLPDEDIARARDLLQQAVRSSHQEVGRIAVQFETLAAVAGEVRDLTSEIVHCVETDCAGFVVTAAEKLGAAAREFLLRRMEWFAVVADVFRDETSMLEKLGALSRDQRAIAREGRALGILAAVEVARLGEAGSGLEYMAQELNEFSAMVTSAAEEVRLQADQRRGGLAKRRLAVQGSASRLRGHLEQVDSELNELIAGMRSALAAQARIPTEFRNCVAAIAEKISHVVSAVQVEDITRQQSDHVCEALAAMIDDGRRNASQSPLDRERRIALLKVQAAQMLCVARTTAEWIDEIADCLESILRASSSDLVAIGAGILEQDRNLAAQLERIADLERESEADHAGIEQFLQGLNGLSQMVSAHLKHSRTARQRMQLLNFNSMIEARRLGSRAAAVLEIARSISRLSSDWGTLTDRSETAMDKIIAASRRAEDANQSVVRATSDSLARARKERREGMTALREASAAVAGNGARVTEAVTRLRREVDVAAPIARGVRQSLKLIEEAIAHLDRARQAHAQDGIVELAEADLRQLETECAAAYTCEAERHVLRAALYGEAIPSSQQNADIGNDVELF